MARELGAHRYDALLAGAVLSFSEHRRTLEGLRLAPPEVPLVGNVTGELYPTGPNAVPAMLDREPPLGNSSLRRRLYRVLLKAAGHADRVVPDGQGGQGGWRVEVLSG